MSQQVSQPGICNDERIRGRGAEEREPTVEARAQRRNGHCLGFVEQPVDTQVDVRGWNSRRLESVVKKHTLHRMVSRSFVAFIWHGGY